MGQFAIQAVCGKGATGTVYRATQAGMERQVAVKVLRADLLKDPDIVKRFVREARAGAKVSHPNIATVHMVGQTEEGAPFIVMEYVGGRSLSALLDLGKPLSQSRIVHLASQIASALVEAHAQGIVHRDLKPENILLSERRGLPDVVKLVDFGIAKILVSYAPGEDAISRMGTVFGTPHYIAPEQASGQTVDGRADLYSLGCILFQMATGRVPFDGQAGLQVLLSQVRDPVVDPREINPKISDELAELILRLLEKDPAARLQTAKEVRAALLALTPGALEKAARDNRASDEEDRDDDDDDMESASDDGPSLDAWASGALDPVPPVERARPASAKRPASGAASLPKSGRRGDATPRSTPRSGRAAQKSRSASARDSEEDVPVRRRERVDDDLPELEEPFYKRHAKPLVGVLGAISFGLLFGVLYAQLRTPPVAVPAPVTPPVTTVPVANPAMVRPIGPARPASVNRPATATGKPATGTPVSATAPTIPAGTAPTVTVPAAAPAVEKPAEKPVEKPVEKAVEKPPEKPVEKPAEKPAEKLVEKPAEKVVEKAAEKMAEKPAEKAAEAAEKTAEKAEKASGPEKSAEKVPEKQVEKPAEKPKAKEPPAEEHDENGTDPYGNLK